MVNGKLALVTGAGGGIGQVTCQTLANEGARIIVTDINGNAAEKTVKTLTGSGHLSIVLDVTKAESVESVFQAVIAKYKEPPTIIVNCAGILLFHSFMEETPEIFQSQLDINTTGTYLVTKIACREIISAGLNKASIVNIASIAADGMIKFCAYSLSKGAVKSFSRAVGKEMAEYGIRCNSIAPGPIDTTLLAPVTADYATPLLAQIPMHRFGKPEEVANLITFLASEKSSYINATCVSIDGGL